MGTKPQTLSFGLTDSPVGLASWIMEKWRSWSDCGGEVDACFGRDTLLTNIMIYWITGHDRILSLALLPTFPGTVDHIGRRTGNRAHRLC